MPTLVGFFTILYQADFTFSNHVTLVKNAAIVGRWRSAKVVGG
jgi:hypothetical protein